MTKLIKALGNNSIKMLDALRMIVLLSAIFFCLFLAGCVNIAVWERSNLAKASMEIDPNPLQSDFQAHNYSSREAAPSHKSSSGGGGCGCY